MENEGKKRKKLEKRIRELKGIEKYFADIKMTIFNVLFVLLKDEEENMLILYFGTIADYFQMHTFPFNEKLHFIWKANSFLENIFKFFAIFDLGKLK